jgi:hypothetical protein
MIVTEEDFSKRDPLVEMINELISLNHIFEEMWDYHPDNPQMVDVVKGCKNLQIKIKNVQKEIERLS